MKLKEIRKEKELTQSDAVKYLGISLRSYQNYENIPSKHNGLVYESIVNKMLNYGYVDEETGILTIEKIKSACTEVFSKYKITYCYLFGSYAKGKANCDSDVDLFVNTDVDGIYFFEIVESLREALKKKVDLINQNQIANNFNLISEILKDGIKIYG